MKNIRLTVYSLFLLLFSQSSFAITKCKDADGKWHYGDHAPDICARSKVTEMNQHGTVVGEQEAPKTEQELEQEKFTQQKEQEIKEQEQAVEDEKRRLLNIYEHVEDIDRVRDNQLHSVQGNIDVHNAYLNAMNNKVARLEKKVAETQRKDLKENFEQELAGAQDNIVKFTGQLKKLKAQKLEIMEKFAREKEQYLALTNRLRNN